ncbi:mitochondrial carrier protein, putative [Bodo saltans]|uniref:Mitochondrial carrier protein, putative n=1 Tax=Bodo saltans TaxID=75058 RepID=A0A0S4IZG7_BODSA|nr:mitochondrial carrier protein, putative [Bodo saltans]|eukprot:CUG31292.1 mitochondrial carrier protein, putative [Bodo saltans]
MASPTTSSDTKSESPLAQTKRHRQETAAAFVAGAVAGACSRTATAPLDRIKIIVQEGHLVDSGAHKKLQSSSSSRLLEVSRMIRNDGGWRAFWRGNGVNCLKAGPEFALIFSIRRFLLSAVEDRKALEEQFLANDKAGHLYPVATSIPPIAMHFVVGASAGGSAQLLLYPLEVVKTRIVVSTSNEFGGGMKEVMQEAYRTGGIRSFYKGLVPNMVGIVLYRGLEVGLYSNVQAAVVARKHAADTTRTKAECQMTAVETAVAGTCASVVAQTATYPLNVVRTRMQTQGLQGRTMPSQCGMCDCMRQLYIKDGVKGLFHGLAANYLKAVPASAIAFVVFEQTQKVILGSD